MPTTTFPLKTPSEACSPTSHSKSLAEISLNDEKDAEPPLQKRSMSPSLESQKQNLNQLIGLIAEQDTKLNRLTKLRKHVKDLAYINSILTDELQAIESSLTEKDDQLREHMNKVDNLNRQSINIKRMRANRIRKSGSNTQDNNNPKPTQNNKERRVSFDPLALLLDAALEGELDLVIQTSKQVPDLNASHDECVTALHNAAINEHYEVAKYLIEAGCDVNIQDSEGWTPLHCAASSNNLQLAKLLIENGALIYATTFSDQSTPAMKCEENEPNDGECHAYLTYIQNNLGVINDGIVYALYDYEAQKDDELSFKTGEELVVLRKDESEEPEWWWAKKRISSDEANDFKEGYIPRNMIGLYRRVKASIVRKNLTSNATTKNNLKTNCNPNNLSRISSNYGSPRIKVTEKQVVS